jgi:tetratricopeptide (TPR) repeat protein
MTRALVAAACVLWLATAQAAPPSLLASLDTDDPAALAAAVTAIEHAPSTPELADTLFAAGRACEDRLHDPARALAIYERVVRDMPDAGVSIAASRRIAMLKDVRDHAREASELATLMADADLLPHPDVVQRTEALIAASWPGAVDAALWLADWQCRTRHFDDAQALYRRVVQQWPGTAPATLAPRNAAGCALDAHDWDLARELAAKLSANDPADAAVRDDLLTGATRGQRRAQLYTTSWFGLVIALVALLASLAEAMLRGGMRRPSLKPPVEVLFLAPITAVISTGSLLTDAAIGPTVLAISVGGLALAWISGLALDLLRARDRAVRTRALVHVILCAVGVLAIGYIAIFRDGLLDMLAETVRFGPGA